MAKISKIRLPNGSEYDLGDAASLASEDVVKMNGNIPVVVDLEDDASTGTPVEIVELTDGTYSLMISDGNGNNVVEYAVHGTVLLSVDSRGIVKSAHLDTGVVKCDIIASSSLTANKILVSDSDKNIVSSSLGISDLITTSNIGSQSVNYANSAGSAQPIFNNATWYTVGDDVRIGDRDVGGCLCLQGITSDISGIYFLSKNGNYGEKLYLANDGNFYVEGRDAYGRAANINPLWLKSLADTNLSSYKLDVDVSFANLENGLFNLYTNWNNSANMPANNGSGMIIPFLDSAYKMHIYGTTAGHLWLGITQNHTWSALKKFMFGYAQTNFTYAVTGIGKIADSNNFFGASDGGDYYWGVAAWSDKRLKKNIKETKVQALDLINKIQLKEFDFIDNKFGRHESIGYVAQDLLDVIPEAVQSIPLSDEEDKQKYGADKLYMVEDKHLIKYLVKAVQELTDIVDKQQQQIDELKNRVVALKEVIEY